MRLGNARLMASIDPTTTDSEEEDLLYSGWSLLFFGDDERTHTVTGEEFFQCPKTWEGKKAACATCSKDGCFDSGQVTVHLKQH